MTKNGNGNGRLRSAMQWVERLGGWAIVAYLVWWATRQVEGDIKGAVRAVKSSDEVMQKMEKRQIDVGNDILYELRELNRRLK